MEPKNTIRLLGKLQALGFDNEAFWRLHHRRLKDETDTIEAHISYCKKTRRFQPNGTNEAVYRRLQFIYDAYLANQHERIGHNIFVKLAEESVQAIPF